MAYTFFIQKGAEPAAGLSALIFPAEITKHGIYNLKTRSLINKRTFKKMFVDFETFLKTGGRHGGRKS